jgi:hypothetical protein
MIRIAIGLSLAFLLALDSAPVSAQNIPNGSYQSSCSNIRVNGNRLNATCTATNGRRIQSSMQIGCSGDISNANGYLRCNGNRNMNGNGGYMNGNGGNMNGGYNRNGNGGMMNGGYDRNGNGGMMNGGYDRNGNGGMMNGNYNEMGRRGTNGRIPNGSYLQSCTNARMNGAMLFAVCSSPDGRRIETSINTQYCRSNADIANRNGYLDCER